MSLPRKPHHKGLKRTGGPQRKTPMPKASKPINPFSKRRAKRDEVYPAMRRRVYDDQGGVCAFGWDWATDWHAPMTDVHHIAGRDGPDPHRRTNLIGLCRTHHDKVHANPSLARELGLMASRHTRRDAA